MEANNWMTRAGEWPGATKNYFEELRKEMRHVTWPSRPQVQATTLVVIAAVFAFAAYFQIVDIIVGRTIMKLFDALTK